VEFGYQCRLNGRSYGPWLRASLQMGPQYLERRNKTNSKSQKYLQYELLFKSREISGSIVINFGSTVTLQIFNEDMV
jgi:hypothetical protein